MDSSRYRIPGIAVKMHAAPVLKPVQQKVFSLDSCDHDWREGQDALREKNYAEALKKFQKSIDRGPAVSKGYHGTTPGTMVMRVPALAMGHRQPAEEFSGTSFGVPTGQRFDADQTKPGPFRRIDR
jgi:hypothetical protein